MSEKNSVEGRKGTGRTYVGLVPLSEGGGIDLDDGSLDEGVGSDKLVVGSVVLLKGGGGAKGASVSSTVDYLPRHREGYAQHRRFGPSW